MGLISVNFLFPICMSTDRSVTIKREEEEKEEEEKEEQNDQKHWAQPRKPLRKTPALSSPLGQGNDGNDCI